MDLAFVLGDAGIDDAGDIVFLVFHFAQKIVVFLVLVVLDLDILDVFGFVGVHHRHARFRLGFLFLDFLFLVLAGGRHVQGRFLHLLGFLFLLLGLGLILLVLVLFLLLLGFGGGDYAGI